MGRSDEYRRLATECLEMASAFESPEARGVLLHMAQVWLRFADRSALSRNPPEDDTSGRDP
jgi:hypothetical protein